MSVPTSKSLPSHFTSPYSGPESLIQTTRSPSCKGGGGVPSAQAASKERGWGLLDGNAPPVPLKEIISHLSL
ncbi:unnamed protein product [Larinioides sclopetarius]|uniref:Uncharacterized protein n=1 Tax=Larinioides sclopetarius TaxID=280406 RepID=A0AAV1ZSA3_9ARAC